MAAIKLAMVSIQLLPLLPGTKYKFAQQWHVACVTPQWFFDSVDSGYCCPEEEYNVDSSSSDRGKEEGRRKGRGEEVPEWATRLQEFSVPSVSDNYFLDGCKVRYVVALAMRPLQSSAFMYVVCVCVLCRFTSVDSQKSNVRS